MLKKCDVQTNAVDNVNKISNKPSHNATRYTKRNDNRGKGSAKGSELTCYRCGNVGHFGRDPSCPAKGKTCRKCGGHNHFATMCKSKNITKTKANVNQVTSDYAFNVTTGNTHSHTEKLPINVGGVMLDMMVDSVASRNIVDANTWENLKRGKIECTSEKGSGTHLYHLPPLYHCLCEEHLIV